MESMNDGSKAGMNDEERCKLLRNDGINKDTRD